MSVLVCGAQCEAHSMSCSTYLALYTKKDVLHCHIMHLANSTVLHMCNSTVLHKQGKLEQLAGWAHLTRQFSEGARLNRT